MLLLIVKSSRLAAGARYYLSPERDAVLAVAARGDGWYVTEHATARPGTGRGRSLREVVAPALLQATDARSVTVHASTASHGLASLYRAELPGLIDVGRSS